VGIDRKKMLRGSKESIWVKARDVDSLPFDENAGGEGGAVKTGA